MNNIAKQKKIRALDVLIERGFASTVKEARAIIMEWRFIVGGKPVKKPGDTISPGSDLKVIPARQYVSRGGLKIEGIFEDLGLEASGKTAVDIGASTGGFTDFLLQNGARSVIAIDVGYGLLSWNLRNSEKVEVMEKTNIRYLAPEDLEFKAEIAVVDVSFISIKKFFKKILKITSEDTKILLLLKPQFELKSKYVKHKGVVKESNFHFIALKDMVDFLNSFQVSIKNIRFSCIKGSSGNIEFWIYLRKSINPNESKLNYDKMINDAVFKAHEYF